MLHAFVLIEARPDRVAALCEELAGIDGVTEVFSVTGGLADIVAIVRVREHDMLSDVVSDRIARLSGITGTETLIAFRAYSRRDLGLLWDIGID